MPAQPRQCTLRLYLLDQASATPGLPLAADVLPVLPPSPANEVKHLLLTAVQSCMGVPAISPRQPAPTIMPFASIPDAGWTDSAPGRLADGDVTSQLSPSTAVVDAGFDVLSRLPALPWQMVHQDESENPATGLGALPPSSSITDTMAAARSCEALGTTTSGQGAPLPPQRRTGAWSYSGAESAVSVLGQAAGAFMMEHGLLEDGSGDGGMGGVLPGDATSVAALSADISDIVSRSSVVDVTGAGADVEGTAGASVQLAPTVPAALAAPPYHHQLPYSTSDQDLPHLSTQARRPGGSADIGSADVTASLNTDDVTTSLAGLLHPTVPRAPIGSSTLEEAAMEAAVLQPGSAVVRAWQGVLQPVLNDLSFLMALRPGHSHEHEGGQQGSEVGGYLLAVGIRHGPANWQRRSMACISWQKVEISVCSCVSCVGC